MSHFLKPLLSHPDARFFLHNARSDRPLATHLEAAFDSARRNRGLLGRERLEPGAALVIAPCGSVHTFFMRFAIDVVFARKDGVVVKVCRSVKPWRLAIALGGAFAAIELAAGGAAPSETRAGDQLLLRAL